MACDPAGKTDKRVNQFNKIKLLDHMAEQIGLYGVKNGNEKLMDYIDLNCGAIPEGDFDHVIDLSAPHQFLSLYMQIAESRFATAVTELLRMNDQFLPILKDYCETTGRDMEIQKLDTPEEAFEAYKYFILDGMPCDETKEVLVSEASRLTWKKLTDTHEAAWKKAGGNLNVYYELQQSFVKGLLSNSKIQFKIENNETFTLQIKDKE